MSEKTTISTIPLEEKTTIEVSGFFHKKLVSAYLCLSSKMTKEQMEIYIKHATDNTIKELPTEEDQINAVSLQTLISLIYEIENSFKNEGKLSEESVSKDTLS